MSSTVVRFLTPTAMVRARLQHEAGFMLWHILWVLFWGNSVLEAVHLQGLSVGYGSNNIIG